MENTIKFAVIGLGNRGSNFALDTIIPNTKCELMIVSDIQDHHFKQFEDLGVKTTTNPMEVLENTEIDAVFIATPDGTHGDYILKAIEYNKHIIVEKPLEITEEKVRLIEEALANYSKVFMVGYVLRYAPLFSKAKELIQSGVIGNIYLANGIDHIHYGGYAFFHDWHRNKNSSHSLLLQKSSHSLDILNWLIDSKPIQVMGLGDLEVFGEKGAIEKFGEPNITPRFCHTCELQYHCEESIHNINKYKNISWQKNWPNRCVFDSDIDVDDHQALLIKYQNKTKLTYSISHFSSFYRREFSFIGNKGELAFDDESNTITITDRLKKEKIVYYIEENGIHGGGDDELLLEFIDCFYSGSKPRADLTSSADVTRLILAAQESIEKNELISI